MSRIIVKNLPKSISVEQLRQHFSSKGTVTLTDVQPKYTKDGKFRQFAFIGFKNETDAATALDYFDNTFVNSARIKVELCENIGSDAVKPWSKHSKQKIAKDASDKLQNESDKKGKKEKVKETDDVNIEEDPKFVEFLEVQKKRGQKPLWSNDGGLVPKDNVESLGNSESESESEEDEEEEEESENEKKPDAKDKTEVKPGKPKKKTYIVKVKGLPKKIKRKELQQFFHPLKYISLRIPKKCPDIAFIEFKNEKSMKKALIKHRGFLNGNRIRVLMYSTETDQEPIENKWEKNSDAKNEPEEALVETGRIFVRNLTYTCKEEDLEELFKKFGPLSEVHLPIDTFTKKIKGFAFVSFLFPEHAVKAFSQLDGTSFQGRTLHLIPSKAKKEEPNIDGMNYKQKKEAQLKSQRNNVHTWNSLFLGANAVADVMAEKYQTSKSKLLEPESKESIAVRMALGETQIVSETKEYLEKNGVHLNAFQTPNVKRSKNVIIVKNLPANTKSKDIGALFKKHGTVQRVILPPSGIAAIVEFEHGTEAKTAFRKLAYSKFEHVPLYLEWAPADVFTAREKTDILVTEMPAEDTELKEDLVEEQEEAEIGATLFVKNLNFDTNEDELKSHFESIGKIVNVTVAKKKDLRNPGQFLSMGYGFVQFKKKKYAQQALKEFQNSKLEGHALELKISNRETSMENVKARKQTNTNNEESTKILVRNIPFEASQKEVKELFKVFGELKSVRLPQKMSGTGQHRGFGFVDFLTQQDAKRAMDSLSQSTHLYGRRLVLEWAETNDNDVETLRRKTNDTFHSGLSKSKKLKQLIEEKL